MASQRASDHIAVPDHVSIYEHQAAQYDRLIECEDDKLELRHALSKLLQSEAHGRVAELGAGTGRLTRLVLQYATRLAEYTACDASASMLRQLEANVRRDVKDGHYNSVRANMVRTVTAPHHRLPLAAGSVDLVLAGWTICYACSEEHEHQNNMLPSIMEEARRILRPGGRIVIWETLGTGVDAPAVLPALRGYIEAMEERYHFRHTILQTDFRFPNLHEAESLSDWFFGKEVLRMLRQEADGTVLLPSFTGMWIQE
ncbi:class I SAM-dependent methyltransferase [Paenibacillus sp. OSY-SE]|uniref:class I SAM-dependent methyltransferase n=1 Tax=Paenibacillus sp. OSY-SE TaxID=1196323 RepID=UPI00031441D7|nr:class I SAM-dependent methyltransferase [Paenibacillus sp. OSY-SE]